MGKEARDGALAPAPTLARVSDIMMAAAAVCSVLLVLGAIRRSSSPRFFAHIVRFTLALGIAAIVIVSVQVIADMPEIRRAEGFRTLVQSGAAKGFGLSATLFLFGCGIVAFSAWGPKPASTLRWTPPASVTPPPPKAAEDIAASAPAGLASAYEMPNTLDFPSSYSSAPTYAPAAGSVVSVMESTLPPVYAMSTKGKGFGMNDAADKDEAGAPGPGRGGWDDGGPAPAGSHFGSPPVPASFGGAGEPLPAAEELRAQIRKCIESKPVYNEEAKGLLQLMATHDAGFAAAIAKLPERQGIGGAVVAQMLQRYRGSIDLVLLTRAVAAALVFWPEQGPSHSTIEDLALRLAEFSHEAAREFARAYALLGSRFSLQYSLKVVLQKYGISQATFDSIRPEEGLTDGTIRGLLAQGRIDLVNDILKPFEIAILEKIGTVVPVYSVIEKNHARYVMNANEFVDLLRKRNVIR
ncbi:MAG: hypothetical protein KIT16_14125 [Rhodospirillaceae bacterium]|nr:hypothetical protein [Rhodospirillaceae bacterium]